MPASAAIQVTNFSVSPADPAAGSNPDLVVKSDISTSDDDDVKNLTLSLPTGALANPSAPTLCTEAQFNSSTCEATSKVGEGALTVDISGVANDVTADALVYFLAPTAADQLPRIGVEAAAALAPDTKVRTIGTLGLRPDAGLDVTLKDIPREAALPQPIGTRDIFIKAIELKLFGTVNGKPFTRAPTACSDLPTKLSFVTHSNATGDVSVNIKPKDCDKLAFAPTLAASAAITPGTDGVEFTSTIAQAAGESGQKQAVLSLPSDLNPRLSALGAACPASVADINACPATATVGSATATTPLLPVPLTGKLVLKAGGTALPLLVIAFPAPVPLQLTGQTSLGGGGLVTTFAGIPDVPLSSLSVKINGGANSVLQALPSLCSGAKSVGGSFTGHSGKTATTSATLAVTGACPAGQTPPGQNPTAKPPTGKLTLSGLAKKLAKLVAKVTVPAGGSPAKTVKLTLPKGLTINTKKAKTGVKVKAGSKTVKAKVSKTRVSVTLTGSGERSVQITISGGALKVSSALKKKVKANKGGTLKAKLTVGDAAGKSHSVSVSAKAR